MLATTNSMTISTHGRDLFQILGRGKASGFGSLDQSLEPLLELTIIQAAELARISPPTMGPMKTLIGLSRIIVETSTCCMFTVTVNGTTTMVTDRRIQGYIVEWGGARNDPIYGQVGGRPHNLTEVKTHTLHPKGNFVPIGNLEEIMRKSVKTSFCCGAALIIASMQIAHDSQ